MKNLIVLIFIIAAFQLNAIERDVSLNGKSWQPRKLENIKLESSKAGENLLVLAYGEYSSDENTELLLHFDSSPTADASGNFSVLKDNSELSKSNKKFGSGSGVFEGTKDTLILDKGGRGLFPGVTYTGDFTVEFWLYGQNLADGETVFASESYVNISGSYATQNFVCFFENRKLVWRIDNFFIPAGKKQFEILLTGSRQLIPGKWSHHVLRYDSQSGIIEYLIDGIPDAITQINSSVMEVSNYYPLYAGNRCKIVIGDKFTGLLDELRFKLEWVDNFDLSKYGTYYGTYISKPIDLENSKSVIYSINITDTKPKGTDIIYYYYIDNFMKAIPADSPEWVQFTPGNLNLKAGRFLQIKAELYTDGTRSISPAVAGIDIRYDQKTLPLPPQVVKASAGNKCVTLRWQNVSDPDIDGYFVYFGEKPGKYFGSEASGLTSPIDVGKNTELIIDNLENGRLYYFTVVSYIESASSYGTAILKEGGNYSQEVNARPIKPGGASQ